MVLACFFPRGLASASRSSGGRVYVVTGHGSDPRPWLSFDQYQSISDGCGALGWPTGSRVHAPAQLHGQNNPFSLKRNKAQGVAPGHNGMEGTDLCCVLYIKRLNWSGLPIPSSPLSSECPRLIPHIHIDFHESRALQQPNFPRSAKGYQEPTRFSQSQEGTQQPTTSLQAMHE